jgi:hypothetical protein
MNCESYLHHLKFETGWSRVRSVHILSMLQPLASVEWSIGLSTWQFLENVVLQFLLQLQIFLSIACRLFPYTSHENEERSVCCESSGVEEAMKASGSLLALRE